MARKATTKKSGTKKRPDPEGATKSLSSQMRETSPEGPSEQPEPQATVKPRRGKFILLLLLLSALSAGGYYGRQYWLVGRFMVTTDDAYLKANSAFVSSKVPGYVARVAAVDNQMVKKGDALVVIDDGDYVIAKMSAQAKIDSQKMTLLRIDAQIKAAQAQIAQARAGLQSVKATADNAARASKRAIELFSSGTVTSARRDTAVTSDKRAQAAVASANAKIAAATANVAVLKAQRAEASSRMSGLELASSRAKRDLAFTILRAPFDGQIANLSAHTGDLVSVGQKLAMVVPVEHLYITANFKETQLQHVVVGETVKVKVDALPDIAFTGRVTSIAPGTGALFSLLPADNATGNFTKIVQRVPARIDLTGPSDALGRLRAGLSVVVMVDRRTAPTKANNNTVDVPATPAPSRVSLSN